MNIYYIGTIPVSDELYHHGILGMKWGVRRYQNPDGTLTPAGKKRYYGVSESTDTSGSGGTSRAHYGVGNASSGTTIRKNAKFKVDDLQNSDGTLNTEGEKKYQEWHDSYQSIDRRGNKVFDRDKYEKEQEDRINQLGENLDKVNTQWVKTLEDIYSDNYSNFAKENRKQIEEGMKAYEELSRRSSDMWETVRAEEAAKRKPSALRSVFESEKAITDRYKEITNATRDRLNSNSEYLKIQKDLNDAFKKIDKAQGKEKTAAMNRILSQLPEKDRQAAYELMRYYWWDYD